MIKIKKFTETDFEFSEICRIFNLVSHDFQDHPDEVKDSWALKDKSLIFDRLFLQENGVNVGYLPYNQGRKPNDQICFFSLYLDPKHEGKGYRQLLFNQMLEEVKAFDCNQYFTDIYEHPNYDGYKNFLERNDFSIGLKIREYSLKLKDVDFSDYDSLLKRLDEEGITFHDIKDCKNDFPNFYEKLEELEWAYTQDFPIPDEIAHTRMPYDLWMKHQKQFEEKNYGTQIVAIHGDKFVGATDIEVVPKSDPHKGWTGGLGVIREYRRKGIATAIKIHALKRLLKNGVLEVRTDNEQNNPMYKINVALGFKPEPYGIEYKKKI